MPDTMSQRSDYDHDVNDYNEAMANYNKKQHDNKDKANEESLTISDFVTSTSGKVYKDIDVEDVKEMAKFVNEAEANHQEAYDAFHDEINTVYAIVKESIGMDRSIEVRALREKSRADQNIDFEEENKKILEKYAQLDESNLSSNGILKGELRHSVTRNDVVLRGMDETNEDSVYAYEDELKSVENVEKSDKESVTSLETHNPIDQISSKKLEEPLESTSKISDGKRPVEYSSEEESSNKRFKQDSSDISSETDSFDPFTEE